MVDCFYYTEDVDSTVKAASNLDLRTENHSNLNCSKFNWTVVGT